MNSLNIQADINNLNTTILGVLSKEEKVCLFKEANYLSLDNFACDILDIQTIKSKLNVNNYLVYSNIQNEIVSKIINLVESGCKNIGLDEVMLYVDINVKKAIIKYFGQYNIHFVNLTNDIEDVLLADYLVIIYNGSVALEGSKVSVLKEEKLIKRMGYSLPFIVDLSLQLNYYGLVKKVSKNKDELVSELWN